MKQAQPLKQLKTNAQKVLLTIHAKMANRQARGSHTTQPSNLKFILRDRDKAMHFLMPQRETMLEL